MISIDHSKCDGRGQCIVICPYGVFMWSEVNGKRVPVPVNEQRCQRCMRCVSICPSKAIKFKW